MSKTPNAIDSTAKRARLAPRKTPYWQGVSGGRGGVSLGYRKPTRGPGSWIGKIVLDGSRIEERIGAADDQGAGPDSPGLLQMTRREGHRSLGSLSQGTVLWRRAQQYLPKRTILRWNYSSAIALTASHMPVDTAQNSASAMIRMSRSSRPASLI